MGTQRRRREECHELCEIRRGRERLRSSCEGIVWGDDGYDVEYDDGRKLGVVR